MPTELLQLQLPADGQPALDLGLDATLQAGVGRRVHRLRRRREMGFRLFQEGQAGAGKRPFDEAHCVLQRPGARGPEEVGGHGGGQRRGTELLEELRIHQREGFLGMAGGGVPEVVKGGGGPPVPVGVRRAVGREGGCEGRAARVQRGEERPVMFGMTGGSGGPGERGSGRTRGF